MPRLLCGCSPARQRQVELVEAANLGSVSATGLSLSEQHDVLFGELHSPRVSFADPRHCFPAVEADVCGVSMVVPVWELFPVVEHTGHDAKPARGFQHGVKNIEILAGFGEMLGRFGASHEAVLLLEGHYGDW